VSISIDFINVYIIDAERLKKSDWQFLTICIHQHYFQHSTANTNVSIVPHKGGVNGVSEGWL